MNQALREITNLQKNSKQITKLQYLEPLYDTQTLTINEVIAVGMNQIDFGYCLPGSVHEKKFTVMLKKNLAHPQIISMIISCNDAKLNDLPEYIFGIRKESSFEYFDQFKFKASQKGTYTFIIGVKTPVFLDYEVSAKMQIFIQNDENPLKINLKQVTKVPEITSSKQLVEIQNGYRILKFAIIRNKSKRQLRLMFKCSENMNFCLVNQLVGQEQLQKQVIEMKQKIIQICGKGLFVLNLFVNYTEQINKIVEKRSQGDQLGYFCLRKILIMRIKDTNIHYHFPIEISFYPDSKKSIINQS